MEKGKRQVNKMNNYLAIITTVLVITQVVRVTQNAISLHRQKVEFKKNLGELSKMEVTKADFEMQRKAYRLIVERLSKEDELL